MSSEHFACKIDGGDHRVDARTVVTGERPLQRLAHQIMGKVDMLLTDLMTARYTDHLSTTDGVSMLCQCLRKTSLLRRAGVLIPHHPLTSRP